MDCIFLLLTLCEALNTFIEQLVDCLCGFEVILCIGKDELVKMSW